MGGRVVRRNNLLAALSLFLLTFHGATLLRAQSGGGFTLVRSVASGGGGLSDGGAFSVNGTIGQPFAGMSNGGAFTAHSGFWAPAGAVCVDVDVDSGWNLVSIPLQPADASVAALFPGAASQAFAYEVGYVAVDALAPGQGVWLKFGAAETVEICGDRVAGGVPVSAGWNIVGVYGEPIAVVDVSLTTGTIDSSFFAYSAGAGYVTATMLAPGQGYWVKVSADGELTWP